MSALPLVEVLPQASRLVFGCMGLGGSWDQQPITDAHVAQAHAAVEAALGIGITVFDHADIYTMGKAEQCFGTLLKRQPSLRSQMLLQSKCGIRWADEHGPKRYDLSAQHILHSVHGILRRLNTEYLDVLLLHRPDPLMQAEEVAQAWQQLQQEGLVRHLGVSNMHSAQIQALNRVLDQPLRINQLEMSLLKLDWLEGGTCFNDPQGQAALAWQGTLEYCQQQGLQLQAWGALARGWLTGAAPSHAPAAVHHTAQCVASLAAQHQVPAESVVLAWLMQHPAHIQPIIGTAHPDRIRACAAATQVRLSRGEWYQLYQAARGRELP